MLTPVVFQVQCHSLRDGQLPAKIHPVNSQLSPHDQLTVEKVEIATFTCYSAVWIAS